MLTLGLWRRDLKTICGDLLQIKFFEIFESDNIGLTSELRESINYYPYLTIKEIMLLTHTKLKFLFCIIRKFRINRSMKQSLQGRFFCF